MKVGRVLQSLRTALLAGAVAAAACDGPHIPRGRPADQSRENQQSAANHVRDSLASSRALDTLFGTVSGSPEIQWYGARRLSGVSVLVTQVEAEHGTGLYQTAYVLLVVDSRGAARSIWAALASESFGGVPVTHSPAYRISSCFAILGDSLVLYSALATDTNAARALEEARRRQRLPSDTIFRAAGIYRLDSHDSLLTFAGSIDSSMTRRCTTESLSPAR